MSEEDKTRDRQFDRVQSYKGGVIGVLALRAGKGKTGVITEVIARRILDKESTVQERKISPDITSKIETLYEQTDYWHGTGRYQYKDGLVVDVLKGIIDQGGLVPHHDDIDLVGPMESVSLARSRIYARAYADMHENGEKGPRHGSALLWAAAHIGPLAIKIAQEEKIWKPGNMQRVQEHFDATNSSQWYEKVRQERTGTPGVFAYGSDIEGNYPILFGIKAGIVEPAKTSKSVAVHEVRATKPITLRNMTHIEVPEDRAEDVAELLAGAGYDLPVFAIEDFEAYMSGQSFTKQVS